MIAEAPLERRTRETMRCKKTFERSTARSSRLLCISVYGKAHRKRGDDKASGRDRNHTWFLAPSCAVSNADVKASGVHSAGDNLWKTFLTFVRGPQIKIHPTDVYDCEIPREIFLAEESGSDELGHIRDADLRVVNDQIA